jgi:hypothetical protein
MLGFLPFFYICFFGASFLVGAWTRCWPYLARESLYPLSRAEFIGDIAKTLAVDVVTAALWNGFGLLVVWTCFSPQELLTIPVLPFLAMSVVIYVATYCLLFWLLPSHRRLSWLTGLVTLGVLVLLGFAIYKMFFVWVDFWTPANTVLALAGVAAAAVVSHRWAYRRWMRMDLA